MIFFTISLHSTKLEVWQILSHKINIKPIGTGTVHIPAKARLTSVAIRKHVLDRVHNGAT